MSDEEIFPNRIKIYPLSHVQFRESNLETPEILTIASGDDRVGYMSSRIG